MAILKSSKAGISFDTETGIRTNSNGTTTQIQDTVNPETGTIDSTNTPPITPTQLKPETPFATPKESTSTYSPTAPTLTPLQTAEQDIQNKTSSSQSEYEKLLADVGLIKGKEAGYQEELGATQAKETYTNYANQLEQEKRNLDLRKRDLFSQGLTKTQAQNFYDAEENKSLQRQADIAILGNAAMGKYNFALTEAKRKVDLELKPFEDELVLKKQQYEDNKDMLTTAEKDKITSLYKREEDDLAAKRKEKEAIAELKVEAAKYGLTNFSQFKDDTTINEAMNIISPYLAKANREIVKVGDGAFIFDKNTNTMTSLNIPGSSTGSVTNPAYSGIVNTILGSGKFTKDQSAQVANAINNGEDPLAVIKNNAKGIMTSTEATKLGSFETAKGAMIDLDSALKEYYANGGKTNILKGNFEKVINNLGSVNDPKLVEIATRIQAVLQVYRNAVSGTAYSVQESKDIDAIFPGITKSEGLNEAILNGRKKAFDATIDTTYGNVLGQDTYKKLKELEVAKNYIPKGNLDDKSYVEKVLTTKNIKYDDFINNTPPDGQIPVIDNKTGEVGYIPYVEFNIYNYTKI